MLDCSLDAYSVLFLLYLKQPLSESDGPMTSVRLDQVRHTCLRHDKHRLCVPSLPGVVADAVPRAVAWIFLGMKGSFPSHFIWMPSAGSAHAGPTVSPGTLPRPLTCVCAYRFTDPPFPRQARRALGGRRGALMRLKKGLKISCCDQISTWILKTLLGLILWVTDFTNVQSSCTFHD